MRDTGASSSLVRFGSVPSDPGQAQAFLQQRLTRAVGFTCVIWTALLFLAPAFEYLFPASGQRIRGGPAELWTHLTAATMVAGLWVYLRRARPSVERLNVIDVASTLLQALLAALLLLSWEPKFRPEFGVLPRGG
jgi:hypothetical protein